MSAEDAGARASRLRLLPVWALGALFVVSAAVKILEPGKFAGSVAHYDLLAPAAVNAFALLLPWWELAAAVALVIPSWRRAGAMLSLMLGGMFLVAVTTAVVRDLDISCGCFGPLFELPPAAMIPVDLGIMAVGTWYILWPARTKEEPAAV